MLILYESLFLPHGVTKTVSHFENNITTDSFVFSVRQAYTARSLNDGSFKSHLRFEPFLSGTWSLPAQASFATMKHAMSELIEHHQQILPNYRRQDPITLDNIAWFVQSTATLIADLDYLFMQYTGLHLPKLTSCNIKKLNSSKNISQLIQNFLQPQDNLAPEENTTEFLAQISDEWWSLVSSFIKKIFGPYAFLAISYIEWNFAPEIREEAIDWHIRPPCGSAYRRQFKELFEEERFARRNKDKKNTKEGPYQKEDKNSSFKKDNNTNFSEKKQYQKEKFDRKDFKKNKFQNDDQINEEVLQKIQLETTHLMDAFQKNDNASEFLLPPQNSFVRRHQHMWATEAGFTTESRGEGNERCVCLVKK